MIEKQHDDMTLLCDDCDTELGRMFDEKEEFREMIAYAKSEGWKITKDALDDSEWVHTCRACTADRAPTRRQLGLF